MKQHFLRVFHIFNISAYKKDAGRGILLKCGDSGLLVTSAEGESTGNDARQ